MKTEPVTMRADATGCVWFLDQTCCTVCTVCTLTVQYVPNSQTVFTVLYTFVTTPTVSGSVFFLHILKFSGTNITIFKEGINM